MKLSGLGNIAKLTTQNINLASKGKTIQVPPKGSLVSLTVLDKIGANYKLLINGNLFQATLPVAVASGEELIGKVIKQNPLVISLNQLPNLFANPGLLETILLKFDLQNSLISKSIIQRLAADKRPLIKSKIQDISEFINFWGKEVDELLLGLLIQFFWNSDKKFNKDELKEILLPFDIPFEKICEKIFGLIVANYSQFSAKNMQWLRETFLVELNENALPGKMFTGELAKYVQLLEELKNLNSEFPFAFRADLYLLLLKYLLQKAEFNSFGIFPDFLIAKDDEKLFLIMFLFEKTKDRNYNKIIKINANLGDYSEYLGLSGFLSEAGFNLTLIKNKNLNVNYKTLEKIRKNLEKNLNLKVSLSASVKEAQNHKTGMIIGNIQGVNSII